MKELSGEQFQRLYVCLALLIVGLSSFPLLPIDSLLFGQGEVIQALYLVLMMGLTTVSTGLAAIYTQWRARDQIDLCRRQNSVASVSMRKPCSERLHLVVVTLYREPLDLITLTIRSLADQPEASRMAVVLGIEEDAPRREVTIASVKNMFACSFRHFLVFVHPKGLVGEIPGKCSNLNYAARSAVAALESMSVDLRGATFTSCDADNIFGRNYFSALEDRFASDAQEYSSLIWQAVVLYNWSPSGSPFFTAITGALRSVWIAGILVPFSINGMSVFSMDLGFYRQGHYTSPAYQMEDILSVIRWSIIAGKRVRVKCLPAMLLSGPTSGRNLWDHFDQWRQQIRRWSIGAGEVFAYAFCHIRASSLPWPQIVPWASCFFVYYFIIQCVAPLAICLGLVRGFLPGSHFFDVLLGVFSMPLRSVILLWLCSLVVVMVLLAKAVVLLDRGMEINVGLGQVSWLRRLLPLPAVLLMHSLIVLEALISLAIHGKRICKHNPSNKDFLPTAICGP